MNLGTKNSVSVFQIVLMAVATLLLAVSAAKFGIMVPILLILISFSIFALYSITVNIRYGFYFIMGANFFSVGLTRYINAPLGLTVDFLMILIAIIFFLKHFKNISWKPLANPVFIAIVFWMLINVFEVFNPEARSFEAWFYAMRGVALYFLLMLFLGFMILDHSKDFHWFVTLWFSLSIFGTLWGLKQLYIGLDEGEKAWLNVPGNLSTHMLFGKLRVFSFYSDSGQFGASQAHTALVAGILAISEKVRGRKMFYLITALLSIVGMLISGTRGAVAIPLVGFLTYLVLVRNFKIIMVVIGCLSVAFYILKFTSMGQGVYQINRLRTALNPNDPSLLVRIENQKKLAVYLKSHIIGGGVGSAGYWGQRFSPDTFLANLALDSWYVRIAAEYGYVGLILYLLLLLLILFQGLRKIIREQDATRKSQLIALFCGLAGILVASYGNQVFGQLPTGIIIYICVVFLTKKNFLPEGSNINKLAYNPDQYKYALLENEN